MSIGLILRRAEEGEIEREIRRVAFANSRAAFGRGFVAAARSDY